MFIRLENIKDSELSWVATNHDTYLVNEYGERIDWDEKGEGYIRYQLIKNYMPSSLIKTVKAAEKKELS